MLRKFLRLCLYAIPAFLPVGYLLLTGGKDAAAFLNQRRLGLLENSVWIALSTAILCTIIAVFAAMRLHTAFRRKSLLRWFFLLSAPIPSYIYALTYMNLIRFLGQWMPGLLRFRMAGMIPCIIVESFAFLPFVCAAALIGLGQADVREWKAALLMQDADRVFYKIILPKQLPYLLAMGAVIFVLSVTDYSIPSLFQVNVYAMEIFSDYSAAGKSIHSLRLALPLLAVSTAVIIPALLPLRNVSRPMPIKESVFPEYSKKMTAVGNGTVVILILQILFPILSLLPYAGELARESVPAWEELTNSFAAGLLAVVLLTIPAAGMALLIAEDDRKASVGLLLWLVALLPLSVPGVLTGIGVLKLFSDTPLHTLRSGNLVPAAGMAVRYLPFSMLIQYGCYIRMDRDKLLAAGLLQARRSEAFFRVKLRLMRPGLVISGIVVFLLTLGDVGTALMLMPAGREPLSVKIYNYLHYGSSETVAVFCLLQVVVCMLVMGMLYLALEWKMRKLR